MGRPRTANRDNVAEFTLSVRLSGPERTRWDALVARRTAELRGTGGRVTAASLARDVLVAHLDALGIAAAEAPPAAPVQVVLPFTPPAATTPPTPTAPTSAPREESSWWFGIGLGSGALEVLHPRQGTREEVARACEEEGLSLEGPFPSRLAAWKAFEAASAEQERRANTPPPPPGPTAPRTPEPELAPTPAPSPPRRATAARPKKARTAKTQKSVTPKSASKKSSSKNPSKNRTAKGSHRAAKKKSR
jgi:hypothetical protein